MWDKTSEMEQAMDFISSSVHLFSHPHMFYCWTALLSFLWTGKSSVWVPKDTPSINYTSAALCVCVCVCLCVSVRLLQFSKQDFLGFFWDLDWRLSNCWSVLLGVCVRNLKGQCWGGNTSVSLCTLPVVYSRTWTQFCSKRWLCQHLNKGSKLKFRHFIIHQNHSTKWL